MFFVGTLCISITVTTLILALKTSSLRPDSVQDNHSRLQHISNQAFYMFAAVFSQGNPQPPASAVLRIIHAFHLIFLVIIVAAYTSQLVTLIAVTKITLPINTFRELAQRPSYKASIPEGTSIFDLFRTADKGPLSQIWHEKLKNNPAHYFPATLEGYQRDVPYVRSSDHVILGPTHRFDSLLSILGGCDLTMPEESILGGYMSMAAYHGFPHTDVFNERYVDFPECL